MLKQLTKDEAKYISGGAHTIALVAVSLAVNFIKTEYNGSCSKDKLERDNKSLLGCQFINTILPGVATSITTFLINPWHVATN